MLNTYQARWQYAADSLGAGFAQGKTMLWRRSDLEWAGGIGASARNRPRTPPPPRWCAASACACGSPTALPAAAGRTHRCRGVEPAGTLGAAAAAHLPAWFVLELLSGLAVPLLAAALAAWALEVDAAAVMATYVALWIGLEAWLAATVGWHLSWRSPALWLLREALLPLLWVQAWLGNGLTWRGTDISLARDRADWRAPPVRP